MALSKVAKMFGEEATSAQFKADVVTFAGDSSYPTGGTSGVAAALGVHPEQLIALIPLSHSGYVWDYDSGVDRLKLYQQSAATGGLTEVPNTTNLSATTFRALMLYY